MFSSRIKIWWIVVLILVIIILCMCVCTQRDESIEEKSTVVTKPTWNRNKCSSSIGDTFENVFKKYGINKSDDGWSVYFPCNYDDPAKEIDEMPVSQNGKYFMVAGADLCVAKDWLWKNVVEYYGIDKARILLPYGYILSSDEDLERFDNEYETNKIYIMKKNIQRQEGLKITKSREDILDGAKQGYVIVQELLDNPYIIDGRKTNMRFYVLVICKNNNMTVYVYANGFMYYSAEKYVKNSTETGPNITSGFISRDVYEKNPLTHDDLRKYLDDPNRKNLLPAEKDIRNQGLAISKIYFQRIYDTIRDVYIAFVGKICSPNKLSNNVTFQLFGIDIAVDDKLQVKMIEANKGPSLDSKDQRDGELKQHVVRDIFNLIGVIDTNAQNGFIKII